MRDKELWPHLFLIIHDETILAVDEDFAVEAGERLTAAMNWIWESPSGLSVPISAPAWDGTLGRTWRDAYPDGSE